MEYKGLIFTNHILERMNQRGIDFKDVYWAWARPDETFKAETPGAFKYYRTNDKKLIAVVAKKNDQGKWVVMTCWQKEVFGQSKKKKTSGRNFWQNFLRIVLGK